MNTKIIQNCWRRPHNFNEFRNQHSNMLKSFSPSIFMTCLSIFAFFFIVHPMWVQCLFVDQATAMIQALPSARPRPAERSKINRPFERGFIWCLSERVYICMCVYIVYMFILCLQYLCCVFCLVFVFGLIDFVSAFLFSWRYLFGLFVGVCTARQNNN